jgi:hypothetical protein
VRCRNSIRDAIWRVSQKVNTHSITTLPAGSATVVLGLGLLRHLGTPRIAPRITAIAGSSCCDGHEVIGAQRWSARSRNSRPAGYLPPTALPPLMAAHLPYGLWQRCCKIIKRETLAGTHVLRAWLRSRCAPKPHKMVCIKTLPRGWAPSQRLGAAPSARARGSGSPAPAAETTKK